MSLKEPEKDTVAASQLKPNADESYSLHPKRMVLSWLVSWGISVFTLCYEPHGGRAPWFVLAVGAALVISIVLQVFTAERAGFIARISYTLAGAVFGAFVCAIVGFFLGR